MLESIIHILSNTQQLPATIEVSLDQISDALLLWLEELIEDDELSPSGDNGNTIGVTPDTQDTKVAKRLFLSPEKNRFRVLRFVLSLSTENI